MPFEIRADCPVCRIEGARVETWEAGDMPSAARCRICDHAGEGRVPAGEAELERALSAWAADEGLASAGELVEGYFVLSTPGAVFAAMARGEVVETTFDVVEYLFSSGHGQGGADAPAMRAEPPARVDPFAETVSVTSTDAPAPAVRADAPPPTLRMTAPVSIRRMGGPRDELLALASVAASDGEASPDDLAVLARAAEARGIPPLAPEDIRVRRPSEIDPPPTLVQREKLLEEMFYMAWSDEQLDESEVRVVRDFARAWGVDPQRVTEWTTAALYRTSSKFELWLDRVGYYFFPGW